MAGMKQCRVVFQVTVLWAVSLTVPSRGLPAETLRPPSVPLVACDPYFSIWSPADHLNDADTVHWTGKKHRLTAGLNLNGQGFALLGKPPAGTHALPQTRLDVLPTRTLATFQGEGIQVTLTFMTAALPDDLMRYSRPVTYVTFQIQATDGKEHGSATLFFDAWPEIAVNQPNQAVEFASELQGGLQVIGIGSEEQPVLQKKGDDLRIDWGHFYLAAPQRPKCSLGIRLPASSADKQPSADGRRAECLFSLGAISSKPVSNWLMLAYDDEFSIQYFKKNLRPYWRRNGDDAAALLKQAAEDYEALVRRCEKFDREFITDLSKVGGERYARICALAYRQCYAANKVVADAHGQPLMFPKENFSNGCIGTVDVIYPMAPQFLLFCPSLAKAMLVPIMDYAASPRWRWPFAPHDLGTYPLANGQVYGGGERTEENQMPVEETGNMLILLAALAQIEGNANFCDKYWPLLEKWADYLKAKGFDPENQLCTDDFAGHLAHNVNLSAKAICGLGALGKLCQLHGDKARASQLLQTAREFAARWTKEADDVDHFRLAFDKPGTWSQKYNLVWDRILELNLFPDSVRQKETAFYLRHQNQFGLPLDNRKAYTKLDWTLWSATLSRDRADFDALVGPIFQFLNQTPNRVPMTDWFMTTDGKQVGFQARSVVGGVFLEMLYHPALWKKWAKRDRAGSSNWAPLPAAPKVTMVLPAADQAGATWRYTTQDPGKDWTAIGFDDSTWKEGRSGFGTAGTPGAIIGTTWNTSDIWLRRQIDLPANAAERLQAWLHHDEDADLFINGEPALSVTGWTTGYDLVPLTKKSLATLHAGKNLIALHCHQTTGGQYIDLGLASVQE